MKKSGREAIIPFRFRWHGETGKFKVDFSRLRSSHLYTIKQKKAMKNIAKIQGYCTEILGIVKQKVALIINDDYLLVEGKEDEIIGRIQSKLGKPRQDVLKYISEL